MIRVFLIFLFISSISTGFAQKVFSIKIAPSLTLTDLKMENNNYSSDFRNLNEGTSASLGFTCGLNVDLPIVKERLSIATGIWFSVRNFTLDMKTPIRPLVYHPDTQTSTYFLIEHDPRYLLHYIQLPATFKVFTNPMSNGNRVYFQAGSLLNFKIAEQPIQKGENYLYELSEQTNDGDPVFKSFDMSLYFAVGYEWKTKSGRRLSASIGFEKGLIKQLRPIEWSSEFNPIDYYTNTKLSQLAVAVNYTFLKN